MEDRAAPSSSSHGPSWADLPREITANILQRLAVRDTLRSAEVCSSWRSVCRDPSMWRFLDLGTVRIGPWTKICRQIVNLSQGQLISIRLGSFATDNLLIYIAQRAKQLRSLCIHSMYISNRGLCKAVKEFPLLEELELVNCYISKRGIIAAGQSCPLLNSFSFSKPKGYSLKRSDDEEALAVAANMRGLKHLTLGRNGMTDEGVKAILDGCPHLESLNLENCYFVCLDGDLGRRCSEQIKDLKHGNVPIARTPQYSFDTILALMTDSWI